MAECGRLPSGGEKHDVTGLIGGVEAGGTKFMLGLRRGTDTIAQSRVPTTRPDDTMAQVARFFAEASQRHGTIDAVGLATFGPVELDQASTLFGCLVDTPKPGWDRYDIRSALATASGAPVAIETDVNAAAFAEGQLGSCRGLERYCYVTVGTGIGVGFVEDGRPARAFPHAEAGHIRVGRAPGDDYAGLCPFHGDCLEGLASGAAMSGRWGVAAPSLPPGHAAWDAEAYYLAALCVNLTYQFRPQRIVLSGGVLEAAFLLDRVREELARKLNGYAPGPYASDPLSYLVAPELADPSPGLVGAFLLGENLAAAKS